MNKFSFDLKLVNLVKQFPILYDKNLSRGQQYAKEKDKVWQGISSQLGSSERTCITRWRSIRDRFSREYRRMCENSEEATNWELFPNILFLKHHCKYGFSNTSKDEINIKYKPKIRNNKRYANKMDDNNIDPEDLLINQQLIALVKEHPVLYHKQYIRDFKKLTAKNDAWFRISKILCLSEEDAYKRWKKLRDRFAREYRCHQITPEEPIKWLYFPDLEFLEDHYRKGVPLPLEKIRRKRRKPENTFEEESCDVDDPDYCYDNIASDDTQGFENMESQSFDYCDQLDGMEVNDSVTETALSTKELPEQQLVNVISNMESLLKQTQKCLSNLQHQQATKVTENLSRPSKEPLLVQRMQILLGDLSPDQKNNAKRKIFQFLCESQMKSANNEMVDDVENVKIM